MQNRLILSLAMHGLKGVHFLFYFIEPFDTLQGTNQKR